MILDFTFLFNLWGWIYWNPRKEIFVIPHLKWPVGWYGLFFALGFLIGYYIFYSLLKRYMLNFYSFSEKDISNWNHFQYVLKTQPKDRVEELIQKYSHKKNREGVVFALNHLFEDRMFFKEVKDDLDKKILKSKSYHNPQKSSLRLFLENWLKKGVYTTKQKASMIADRLVIYMVVATIIGARLGHLIFYENISYYIIHPFEIFNPIGGIAGLSSHGAAVCIFAAMFLFRFYLRRFSPQMTAIVMLDLISIPAAFAGGCIRIGNFFNQEILGKATTVCWAIIFGHPADGSLIVARHPVQLYESLFYFSVCVFLFILSYKWKILLKKGKLIGLFLILIFLFRFFIEFVKIRQSILLDDSSFLLMGQYLSIPFIILGLILFFSEKLKVYFKR